jgi:pimeloyl-ACP methyl ester carboxylesterase
MPATVLPEHQVTSSDGTPIAFSRTGDGPPLTREEWEAVRVPTLVGVGGKSPAWMCHAMRSLADILPDARHRTLDGQTHMVKPAVLAPVLAECFGSAPVRPAGPASARHAS